MSENEIVIRGAREHNLQDISLKLPRQKLIVMTGVSGSGKSSLAFDTVYAEGQRRYIESLSTYARQFLGQLPKPNVDAVSGLAPCISIQQKVTGRNPRSTVGTITEIYDYLRILFARVGQGYCYVSGLPIKAQSTDQIVETLLAYPPKTKLDILAPLVQRQKGEYKDLFDDLYRQGFLKVRVDDEIYALSDPPSLRKNIKHTIDLFVDQVVLGAIGRTALNEIVEQALKLGNNGLICLGESPDGQKTERFFSAQYACAESGMSYAPPSPQLFSFNSPSGMCPDCNGLGVRYDLVVDKLVAEPQKSFSRGAIPLVGSFGKIGKSKKNKYKGAARLIEETLDLKEGSVLKTAWKKLPEEVQNLLLYGLGDREFYSGGYYGRRYVSYYGKFTGVVSELLESYRTARNPMRKRQLEKYMETTTCSSCGGTRLNQQARHVKLTATGKKFCQSHKKHELSITEVCALTIAEAYDFFEELKLDRTGAIIAEDALKEIRGRLGFLLQCGLDYLSLERTAPTLSGGESQRIRLAGQIGSGLSGIVYILDEPSIGLHPRDNDLLLGSLTHLRDMGNTVIVVEHDEETMQAADYIVDFGPGPGHRGGEIVARGKLADIKKSKKSITGQYLAGKLKIDIPKQRRKPSDRKIKIIGASHNNLKNVDVEIPLGCFVCITGVSGSGKSSLTNDILWKVLKRDVNGGDGEPGEFKKIEGLDWIDKAIDIDQSPIGRTPRSNPATYVKVFDLIRNLFTQLPASKVRGYKPGRFSFNVKDGRCEACEGHGANKLDMDFLADMWVTCPVCQGKRFRQETLEIEYRGYNIADILDLEIGDALPLFENHPKIQRMLQTLHDVGLDYLKLGQPSPTLSGGEAQRIKLARELGKRSTGKTLYLLDEPTTGLHFHDVNKLLEVLHRFCDQGNTVVVIEHHLDVIKTADWVIDLGPEGGAGGGEIVIAGPPEKIARCERSYTGRALQPFFPQTTKKKTTRKKPSATKRTAPHIENGMTKQELKKLTKQIVVRGARQHNLQDVDLVIPRNKFNVFSGPSGSGKTSLAMDTLYAEGQRRYVESLSAYARQFLGQMPKPKVSQIQGLSPAIAIEQKTVGSTPRSTIGTVTEIYDYLRVLYARLGTLYCPECEIPVVQVTVDDIVDQILQYPAQSRALLLAQVNKGKKQTWDELWASLKNQGYSRVRISGETYHLDEPPELPAQSKRKVEVVIDRISIRNTKANRSRIAESVETGLGFGDGQLTMAIVDENIKETKWEHRHFSVHLSCEKCHHSFERLTPQNFSFNSQLGWCDYCEGLGVEQGVRQSAIIADSSLTLLEGAISAWPNPLLTPLFRQFLEGISEKFGIPLDVPLVRLSEKQQRILYYGSEEEFEIPGQPGLKAKYRGLYPALHDASHLSYHYRRALYDHLGEQDCSQCQGTRLRSDASHVQLSGLTMPQLCRMPLRDALAFLENLEPTKKQKQIAGDLIEEATHRLRFLVEVGLEYLTLDRPMPTLSGGESQRIRLAGQLGRSLTGVLYVLDEPTIGLHPRDNKRLIGALEQLRNLGNTILLIEHDREVIEAADRLVDFGPAAGRLGGHIVSQGTVNQVKKDKNSLTGKYLSERLEIPVPQRRELSTTNTRTQPKSKRSKRDETPEPGWIHLTGARHHNLRNVDLSIPRSAITCVTGVSGSGKSSLIMDTLAEAARKLIHYQTTNPGLHTDLTGIDGIQKVVVIDQQPIGNTPSSCPATYIGVFDHIRSLFAKLPEAKKQFFHRGQFSFNVEGGRCEECAGLGQKCIEMHFLPDVWVECPVCNGKRFNEKTLGILYRGHNISDVLNMSARQACELFADIPNIYTPLKIMCEIGLDYLNLGQSAPTLSGGESQRIKLAAELSRPNSGRTLYILDEPTTGLHVDDISKLMVVLNGLVDIGNTVVIVEHNLDVIKTADWVVDIGPEAGSKGGWIIAQGTPEQIVGQAQELIANPKFIDPAKTIPWRSWTGELLAPVLEGKKRSERKGLSLKDIKEEAKKNKQTRSSTLGKQMPWIANGKEWHLSQKSLKGKKPKWTPQMLETLADILTDQFGQELNWNSPAQVTTEEGKLLYLMDTGLHREESFYIVKIETSQADFLKMTVTFPILPELLSDEELEDIMSIPGANKSHWDIGLLQVIFHLTSLEEIASSELEDFLDECFAAKNSLV